MEHIRTAKVSEQKDDLKKFLLQEEKFLRDLEWFVSDHMITTKKRINTRRKQIKALFEKT